MRNWKFEKIKKELDKCDLLCNNCHGEVHEKIINGGQENRTPTSWMQTRCAPVITNPPKAESGTRTRDEFNLGRLQICCNSHYATSALIYISILFIYYDFANSRK